MTGPVAYQPDLFEDPGAALADDPRYSARSGAFVDNMSLPIHRWFRYSAGFSADWVRTFVRQRQGRTETYAVLDPFAGVATTLLACNAEHTRSVGFESHPFVYRIAKAKLAAMHADHARLRGLVRDFLQRVASSPPVAPAPVPPLLAKCYAENVLGILFLMKRVFADNYDVGSAEAELLWLAITSILRVCSAAGTAQWQYVLPKKRKAAVQEPMTAFQLKVAQMLRDVEFAQRDGWEPRARILPTDARSPEGCPETKFDAVITSPPYPNNYDYADATRLEMTFWGEVSRWADLQRAARRYLVVSCSQHAAAEGLVLDRLLSAESLAPIREPLSEACRELASQRATRRGRKSYDTMAAAYFTDLALVFRSLRRLCGPGSVACFIVGDSAPYGVHLRVDEWLGELALSAGFRSYSFEKIRDRNVKWKNRKHKVPLKEGRLWIEG